MVLLAIMFGINGIEVMVVMVMVETVEAMEVCVGGNLLMTVVSRHHCKTSMKWFCNYVIASFIIFSTTGIAGW